MDISNLLQALSNVHLEEPTYGVMIAAILAAILLILSGFASMPFVETKHPKTFPL